MEGREDGGERRGREGGVRGREEGEGGEKREGKEKREEWERRD